MIRVGFTLIGGNNWLGGAHYLRNLLQALARYTPGEVQPVLFVGTDVLEENLTSFRELAGCEIVRASAMNHARRPWALLSALVLGCDPPFERALNQWNIDVLFEAAVYFGWRTRRPVVAWMPDFQHRAMPGNFRPFGWLKRELGFRAQILGGRMIMLSSADALSACKQHYSIDVSRARVVRFAVPPPAAVNEASARATADRYGLPADYFFMPNQYYVHKNHTLVLEALLALRRRGRRVVVMAPGRHFDPSNMPYVDGFLKRLRDEQITDQFIAPGLIPYEDLADLMHASVALLNPSLYEGWSTTVEEARSAGVPMLLSDIDVHKEQAGDQARYFAPREAAGLADLLQSYVPLSAEARTLRRLAAGIDAQARLQTYARNFVDLSRESIDREV